MGGELEGRSSKKWSRIISELDRYNKGENISGVSKQVLLDYDLIDVDDKLSEQPNLINTKEEKIIKKPKSENVISINNKKFNLKEQIEMYTKYLNGYFHNHEEEKLKKVVDKINRVYYNDSKSNNVHVYDYIRNLQINE